MASKSPWKCQPLNWNIERFWSLRLSAKISGKVANLGHWHDSRVVLCLQLSVNKQGWWGRLALPPSKGDFGACFSSLSRVTGV